MQTTSSGRWPIGNISQQLVKSGGGGSICYSCDGLQDALFVNILGCNLFGGIFSVNQFAVDACVTKLIFILNA